MTGEKLQENLNATSTRFREPRIVFTTDMIKMYRQIKIANRHRKYQLILWHESSKDPIKVFALDTDTQGMRHAGHSALRSVWKHADDLKHRYPRAAYTAKFRMYMDDVLDGDDTVAGACSLCDELTEFFREGCFELGKWNTNSPEVLEHLNQRFQRSRRSTVGS